MKVLLMHRDRTFDTQRKMPPNELALMQDLELGVLLSAMAGEDKFLQEVTRRAILSGLADIDEILYRQSTLKDCLKNHRVVRDIYKVAEETTASEKGIWGWYNPYKSTDQILGRSVKVLQLCVGKLNELRGIVDQHSGEFESEGFKALFAMLKGELSDEYLASVQALLNGLESSDGTLIKAELGQGNKGTNYALCRQPEKKQGRMARVFGTNEPRQFTYSLDTNDNTGTEMLSKLRDRGINEVANTLAQSSDHVLGFFTSLRTELAFYVGCLNLQDLLTRKGEPTCFPTPRARGGRALSFEGLYDAALALKLNQRVVPNDLNAEGKDLVVITGANRGGKSTLLRSIGLAQLMMQCGAFVAAKSFASDLSEGLFTHFKREEDTTMRSGKLDEELRRMSEIVDNLSSDSAVLFNESFAATNEREGSEISRQIVGALLERRVKVFFVTHQYEFAHSLYERKMANAVFLRAERKTGGERTFKVVEGEPLETSYGEDLYDRIFLGAAPAPAPAAPATTR
ncbi:MAG: DNA mismatch repair protein MutS [Thaumarchaeota archaeon]|nr:DNA mismatch repair protein MutS [Nitrososphaerota archaeon]